MHAWPAQSSLPRLQAKSPADDAPSRVHPLNPISHVAHVQQACAWELHTRQRYQSQTECEEDNVRKLRRCALSHIPYAKVS